MTQTKKLLDFTVSVAILVCSIGVFALFGAYSMGFIDLSSEPTVQAEENTSNVPRVPASEHPDMDGVLLENLIFERVNEKRVEEGKDPFVHSERVRLIARIHSNDMADRDFFDHTNPDGNGSSERHERYEGCKITNENIAMWENPPTSNESELARKIVNGWANSSGHKENMYTSYDKVSAVGVYVTENRSLYVTQNFCREHPNA